jgi:hypothetical protein
MFQAEQENNSYLSALQHSFFKKVEESSQHVDNMLPVQSFDPLGENLNKTFPIKNDEFNDMYTKCGDNLLSTMSSRKSETINNKGPYEPGSGFNCLYSGFFGQKNDNAMSQAAQNFYTVTKPFPMAEDEKKTDFYKKADKVSSGFDLLNCQIGNKRQKAETCEFNGSFIDNFSGDKINQSNVSNITSFSNSSYSFNDLVKSVSLSNLKKKKGKFYLTLVLSSEELMLEKIKKEKEEMQRLRNLNSNFVDRAKNYLPKPINPSPLTIIKPFNLSSNNNKMLTKKRTPNSNIEEVNSRITDAMKKKFEGQSQNPLEIIKLQKTPPNVKYMKKTSTRSRSKSPMKTEEDLHSLSSRIEKYCVISGRSTIKSKSPTKNLFSNKEDGIFNLHLSNIMNTTKNSNSFTNSVFSSSMKKHFSMTNMSTEDKIAQEMKNFKFKAKPLNKNLFAKKPEIESFESILQKTRMEKKALDFKEKEDKKMNKIAQIKTNKFRNVNKENFNQNYSMKVDY